MVRTKRARVSSKMTSAKRRKITPARKRRSVKRARINRSKKLTLPKFGFLPDKVTCRLKATSAAFTLDVGAAGIAVVQNLKFNTPHAGFNNRQPREWDEIIALYGKCWVIGAKITIEAPASTSSVDNRIIWGIYTVKQDDPAATYPTGLSHQDIVEDHRLMKGTRSINYINASTKSTYMTKKWSAKKWSRVSDYISSDNIDTASSLNDDCGAAYIAGCNVWAVNPTDTDSGAVTFYASIEYICVFGDRNAVGPSGDHA